MGALPTRHHEWMALSPERKLLWAGSRLVRIVLLYGVFATIVVWDNLLDAFAAVVNGEESVWTLLSILVADSELLVLLVITLPVVAFLVIAPHRRVHQHGREVP